MLNIVAYLALGLLAGATIALVVFRIFARAGQGQHGSETQQRIIDAESELRITKDRLERSEQTQQQLSLELAEQNRVREEISGKFSSLNTLHEQTNKRSQEILKDYTELKDDLRNKTELYQELSRKFAASEMKTDNLTLQVEHLSKEIETLKVEKGKLQGELALSRERTVELENENKYHKQMLDKQKGEIEDIGKKFSNEFKLLADSILEDKSKRFTELNQTNIELLLKPLGENIQLFQKKVDEVYDRESKERFSLGKEVEKLVQLNQRISEEANNLTNALKGQVKQQGNWGEMILESILERSGLVKDREYFTQESFKDEEGKRFQPDVIIKYPDNRKVIIDSKVSLTAYERYCSSQNSEEQNKELALHVKSIRSHIDILSSKGYQDLVGSLDFVTMFLPVEPAFIVAMQADPEIWNYAYSKGVLLLSPTNLIAALRLIHNLWQREYQNRHAMEIAERGGQLYDKFVGFVDNLTSLGDSLSKSQKSYEQALSQLSEGRGNLVSQAQKLKDLGAKAKKSLPEELIDNHESEIFDQEQVETNKP